MKIAICFASFLRSFPVMVGNWNYRLRNYDCDFFIHAPNIYYTPLEEGTYDARDKEEVDPNFLRECFGEKLKGLNLFEYNSQIFKNVIDSYNFTPINYCNQLVYRVLSYQYNIQNVAKMVFSTEEKYDFIMITRGDLNLYSDFNFEVLDNNKINYPVYHGLTKQGHLKDGVAAVFGTDRQFNDQMFIGTSDKIKLLCNIYDMIPQYYSEEIPINSETLLGHHYLKNNIDFGKSDFIRYDMLRYASSLIKDI